jgi:hypothetical protein
MMDYVIHKTERKLKLKKRDKTAPLSLKTFHNEKCKYFENLQNIILPRLKKKKSTQEIREQIKKIEDREEETEYFLNVSCILSEYFSIDSGHQEDESSSDKPSRKMELVEEYFDKLRMNSGHTHDLKIDIDKCPSCNQENSISDEYGSTCTNCGLVTETQKISESLSYKENQEVEHVSTLCYNRIDYFKQWLNQIQAKEYVDIPTEVIDTIIIQLKKERKLQKEINISSMKKILKKTNNSNFFSYPYTIRKFCQILGLNEYLCYFPLLKSREKIYKQDIIWKKIIQYLQDNPPENELLEQVDWVYISSI